jgi:hypothetical protein
LVSHDFRDCAFFNVTQPDCGKKRVVAADLPSILD